MEHVATTIAQFAAAPATALTTAPFEAALAAVRQAERTMRKLDKADTAARDAAEAARAAVPELPRPEILTVTTPPMTLIRGDKTVQTEPYSFTYKDAESIERTGELSDDHKAALLAALAEYDAAQAEADETSGYAILAAAERNAHAAYMASLEDLMAAVRATLLVPTRDPAAIKEKRALIEKHANFEDDEAEFLRITLDATLAADAPPPAPPSPTTDPAAAAYLTERRLESDEAHGVFGIQADASNLHDAGEPAEAMLAAEVADVQGIATRLGYILSNAFIHRAGDWDCPHCLHKREAITPPTDTELCASAEGQNGGQDALFRALASLHLSVEKLAGGVAIPSPLDAILAESDRLSNESCGLPDATHAAEIAALDEAAGQLHDQFIEAPIASTADAVSKLRWVYRGYVAGHTNREPEVLRQLMSFLGADPEQVLESDRYYDLTNTDNDDGAAPALLAAE